MYNSSPEDGYGQGDTPAMQDMESAFSSKSIRMAFIRKVYSILVVQLAITFGFVLIFSTSKEAKLFAVQNSWLIWVCFGVSIVTILTITCCEGMRRRTPHNFILLGVFTLAEGLLLGIVTGSYKTEIVLYAVLITAVVVLALTAFAFQSKYDFTVFNGIMIVALIILIFMGFLMIFIQSKIMMIIYSSLGALIFSVFLVIDTQMIVGGSHKYQISPEEYIFASLTLYLDIINLFIYILQLLKLSE